MSSAHRLEVTRMKAVETLEHAGYTINIFYDEDAQSPIPCPCGRVPRGGSMAHLINLCARRLGRGQHT